MYQLSFGLLALRRTGVAYTKPGRAVFRAEETMVGLNHLEMAALGLFGSSLLQDAIWHALKSSGVGSDRSCL